MRQIAQVLKSNGTDGELVLSFRDINPDDISTTEPLFIYFDGLAVPFFIEKFTKRGQNKALVHLTDIDTFHDAEEIAGRKVYSDSHDFEEDEDDLSMLVGWILFAPASPSDSGHNNGQDTDGSNTEEEFIEIGEITDFVDIPNNPCIEVETKNGTAMIPLHEDLIISLDPESREIIMEIPEGLIDV